MLQNVKRKILVILAAVVYVVVFSNVLLYTNVYASTGLTCKELIPIYNNGSNPYTGSLKGYTNFTTASYDTAVGINNSFSCSPSTFPSTVTSSNVVYTQPSVSCSIKSVCVYSINFYYPAAAASSPTYDPVNACMFNGQLNGSCYSCLLQNQGNNNFQYIYTDFGCVNSTPSGVVNFIYILAIVISSMLAFITLLIGGFLIMTSSGDPDKVNRGKTLVRNAIIGLIVIILAVVILGLIGSIFNISQIAL